MCISVKKQIFILYSLSTATKWLSSTAIRLFSSSSDDINEKETQTEQQAVVGISIAKRGRGRPRKDPNAPKVPRFVRERREVGQRRLSVHKIRQEDGPNDGEIRFMLTFNALPKNLQIIAKTLYPPTNNKYEEHRLVCKLLNEEDNTKRKEIFIPTFRKLSRPRTTMEGEKGLKEKVFFINGKKDIYSFRFRK